MQAFDSQPPANMRFSADTALWLVVATIGLCVAILCGLLFVLIGATWLLGASRDALALGFALPALLAFVIWTRNLRAGHKASAQRGSSQASQLGATLWVAGALAVCLAQGYVNKAFILGEIPLSLSISLGAAALSPLAVWRTRPDWLRCEESR